MASDYTPGPCGCYVRHTPRPGLDHFIVYCDTHAATPKLAQTVMFLEGVLEECGQQKADLLAAGQRVTKAFRPGGQSVGEQAVALRELDAVIAQVGGIGR